MKKLLIIILLAYSLCLVALEPHFMFDPAISPDGDKVCFTYQNRLWTVDWEGGTAHCLTSVDHSVSSPQYSPDGKTIAYMSAREGYQIIYTIPSEGGSASAVTHEDYSLCGWFPDGRSLLVTRYQEKYNTDYYKLSLDGKVEKIASWSGSFSSLNKQGDKIIFSNRGYPYRESYEGSANGDLWIYDMKQKKYERLTETDYTERYPQFSQVSDRIFFGASDGEIFQLYQVDGLDFSSKKQLTNFKEWSLRDLDVADNNDRIVFEHFDKLYRYDAGKAGAKAEAIEIEIKEDLIPSPVTKEKVNSQAQGFAISEDGKLLVFVYKFDLFAMPVKGGEVKQITFEQKGIEDIVIMSDNKTVLFSQITDGYPQLYRFNINDMENVEKLKWGKGKYIEFLDNQYDRLIVGYSTPEKRYEHIAVGDSVGNNLKKLPLEDRTGYGVLDESGRYFLYRTTDFSVWNYEMKLFDKETKTTYSLEKTSDWFSSPVWGKDGESAFYSKAGDIYRLDLQPKNDYYYDDEDNWEEILATDEDDKAKKDKKDKEKDKDTDAKAEDAGLEIDFEDLADRLTPLVSKDGYSYIVHITDEMIYYMNKNTDDRELTLNKIKYSGEDDKELETLPYSLENFSFNNGNFYYINHGKLFEMPQDGGKSKVIDSEFKYEYDRHQLNKDIFDQVWLRFGRGFYDPDMHDLDWQKIYKKYSEYLQYAHDTSILGAIVDEMIGEVNASHTGFYPRSDSDYQRVGRAYFGAVMDWQDLPGKGVRFKKVYHNSSLALDHKIQAKDVLLAVNGEKVGKNLPFDQLFREQKGEKIEFTIDNGDSVFTVEIKGLSSRENYDLWYEDWVYTRRSKVDELSHGRIAYSHIEGMNNSSYERFEEELFGMNFDKDALIIDIRFNGGGYTHDMILETLMKKQYGWSSSRYADAEAYPTPRDIWQKPIVLLIDEDSFSDAEIFPILFKNLNLGKVIGMPTSGSVIGTGHINFMDGSSMRMPSSGWYEMDHANMEGVGAHPDILVPMSPEDYINDNDKQLQRAIDELLNELN